MAFIPTEGGTPVALPAPEMSRGAGVEWCPVPGPLVLSALLTRGLGQNSLAVASLALIGHVAGRKPGPAIGEYSAQVAGASLPQAVRTPAFWLFALAASFYGLVTTGQSLFRQSILAERNFDPAVFRTLAAVSPLAGPAANLATGRLATRVRLGRLLAAAMVLQRVALASFPNLTTLAEADACAAVLGNAGGMVTTIFYGVWRTAYGTAHLGQI